MAQYTVTLLGLTFLLSVSALFSLIFFTKISLMLACPIASLAIFSFGLALYVVSRDEIILLMIMIAALLVGLWGARSVKHIKVRCWCDAIGWPYVYALYIHRRTYIYIHLSPSLYIYISIYLSMCIYIYVYLLMAHCQMAHCHSTPLTIGQSPSAWAVHDHHPPSHRHPIHLINHYLHSRRMVVSHPHHSAHHLFSTVLWLLSCVAHWAVLVLDCTGGMDMDVGHTGV